MKKKELSPETFLILISLGAILLCTYSMFLRPPGKYEKRARITTTKSTIRAIDLALTRYHMDTKTYPTTKQGLDALMEKPSNPGNWNGPYLQDYPIDAWSEDFTYKCPGEDGRVYDIISGGPTASEEDDIRSWELRKRKNRNE